MPRYRSRPLERHTLPSFEGGYNSYTAGKSTVGDKEIPYGVNVDLDDVGSMKKRSGHTRYGPEVASGSAVYGIGFLKTSSLDEILVASGTAIYNYSTTASSALTGATFTTGLETHFCQAFDRTFIANGTDALYYTSDGATVSAQSNGIVGKWPVYYNQRIYMTKSSSPDRIYYSNPYTFTQPAAADPTIDIGNLGSFNSDLSASPKKNAGFIILMPGAGLEITGLFVDSVGGVDYLFAHTTQHGIWRVVPNSSANADGSISHTITRVATIGAVSGASVIKVGNDQWFYGGDNIYTLGDVQNYSNIRVSPKSGRIKSEVNSIASTGKSRVASGFYRDAVYFSYQTGSYNDKVIKYDTKLNAWSSPFEGLNISTFAIYEDSTGAVHFLGGSSDSTDSYIFELESGLDDVSLGVESSFETKSTDCKLPGLIKRFAFVDVFYSMVYGTLTYEVFIDETSSITGESQLGNSASLPVGVGSMSVGSFMVGADYDPDTTFADLAQNDSFRIDCGFSAGKKISVRFTNNESGEQFKINGIVVHFQRGSVYESASTSVAVANFATYA